MANNLINKSKIQDLNSKLKETIKEVQMIADKNKESIFTVVGNLDFNLAIFSITNFPETYLRCIPNIEFTNEEFPAKKDIDSNQIFDFSLRDKYKKNPVKLVLDNCTI